MSEYKRFQLLAEYNQWMNIKLYGVCSRLPEDELRLDRKAFFGSIYMTLNHIMYGDLAFLSRFTGHPAQIPELGQELVTFRGSERSPVDREASATATGKPSVLADSQPE